MMPAGSVKSHWPAWVVAGGLLILACLQLWRVYPHDVSALAPGERPAASAGALDFARVELHLAKLYRPDAGDVQLASEHRPLLKKAVAPLPADLSQAARQRLQWLTQQAFPGRQGKQLSELLLGFYHWRAYQSAQSAQSAVPDFDAAALADRQAQLEKTAARLQDWFGPANARTLFGRDLDVQYYLLQRRRVLADNALTPEQQQVRLQQLTEKHQRGDLTLFADGPAPKASDQQP